jgi:hypothetical protein
LESQQKKSFTLVMVMLPSTAQAAEPSVDGTGETLWLLSSTGVSSTPQSPLLHRDKKAGACFYALSFWVLLVPKRHGTFG